MQREARGRAGVAALLQLALALAVVPHGLAQAQAPSNVTAAKTCFNDWSREFNQRVASGGTNTTVEALFRDALLGFSACVGLQLANEPTPPTPLPAPAATPPSSPPSSDSNKTTIIIAVLCTVGLGMVLKTVIFGVWLVKRHMRKKHRSLTGRILPPEPGQQTTLVVTDVQDSTTLFELLPVSVVDKCMQLLCGTTRALLHKYNGYESCTEGDSFTLAFHSAQDAVCFCIDLQAELLKQPWPVELLEVDGVPSVHNVWALPQSRAPLCAQMMVGQRIAPVPEGGGRVRWNTEDEAPPAVMPKPRVSWLGWVGSRGTPRTSGTGRSSVDTPNQLSGPLYVQSSRSSSNSFAEGDGTGAAALTAGVTSADDLPLSDVLPSPRVGAMWGPPANGHAARPGDVAITVNSSSNDKAAATVPANPQLLRIAVGNSALDSGGESQRADSVGQNFALLENTPSAGTHGAATPTGGTAAATTPNSKAAAGGTSSNALTALFRGAGASAASKLGAMLSPAQASAFTRSSGNSTATPPGGVSSASISDSGARGGGLHQRKLPPRTVRHALQAAWQLTSSLPGQAAECTSPATNDAGDAAVVSPEAFKIWGGMRVRCGVASGLEEEPDVSQGRASYASSKLMYLAKAMEACAHGGQVLLSESTLTALGQASLPNHIAVLHMGKHAVTNIAPKPVASPPSSSALRNGSPLAEPSAASVSLGPALPEEAALDRPEETSQEGQNSHRLALADPKGKQQVQTTGLMDEMANTTYVHVFGACHAHLLPRITTLPPLKVADTLVLDVTHAPLDIVTISFMYLVGYSTLRAWNAHEAYVAQEQFADCAKRQLRAVGGYLVEVAEGFLLTAFSDPYASLRWALAVQRSMMHLPWARRLLEHELTEEVQVMQSDGKGGMQPVVLFRGPRIKVGMDMGSTRSEVHATIRRMAYRGKVMNRAARIAATAHAGQVLCSHEVWVAAALAGGGCPTDSQVAGLQCLQLGATNLKGIKERIKICQVSLDTTKGAWKGNLLQMAGALASG